MFGDKDKSGAASTAAKTHDMEPAVAKAPAAASKAPDAVVANPATREGEGHAAEKSPATPTRKGRGRKKADKANGSDATTKVQFFLGDKNSPGAVPALTTECKTEDDAILDSFKNGVPFYRVETWMGSAGVSNGNGTIPIFKAPVK